MHTNSLEIGLEILVFTIYICVCPHVFVQMCDIYTCVVYVVHICWNVKVGAF